jgi:uroporphyrin-III C-methyltransferase / precorrin-2 dehydrogenase / sirohydrochlorin ferrochelatase
MSGFFPHLPLFLDLAGRAAVLLSGEEAVARVARRLLDAGAGVTLAAVDLSPPMQALAPSLRVLSRRWRASDFDGVALVVAGAREPRAAMARAAARNAGAIYLAPEEPAGVSAGAAASWGPLAIGVSAAGLAPGVAEAVLHRFEGATPSHYGGFLAAAARQQARVGTALAPELREGFWRSAAADAFDVAPGDWDGWLLARLTKS